MTVRKYKSSDLPALRQMAAESGFPYPDPTGPRIEVVLVVVDDDDRPVMAYAAERIVQSYLWCGKIDRPHAKVFALRLLHEAAAVVLNGKGYDSVEAFLPPEIAKRFSRRLEKTFAWVRNWPSWTHRLHT